MATMLERAARALKDEIGKALDAKPLPFAGDTGNWSAKGDMQTLDLEACVRAVLMAVREPSRTEQVWMMDGRLTNCSPEVAEGWRQEYERNWRAMIDAILADGEGR